MRMRNHRGTLSFLLVLLFASSIGWAQDEQWTKEKLFAAARNGEVEQVKSALEAGIDVNAKTDYGATALFYACDRGHEEVVDILLKAGADPNAKDTFYNATPLTWAQSKNHFKIVGMLFAHGGEGADNMLLTAVAGVNAELAKIVLDSGAVSMDGLRKAKTLADKKNNQKLNVLFEGLEISDNEPKFKVSPEILKKYEGDYKQGNMLLSVKPQDDKLMIAFGQGQHREFQAVAKDEFMLSGTTIKFDMSEDEQAVKQVVVQMFPREFKLTPVDAVASKESSAPDAAEPDAAEPGSETRVWKPSSEASKAADRAVSSSNWPSFRGLEARGIADGQNPPTEWNVDEETNLLWKTPIDGLGLSCPVIWGNQLFITSAVSENADDSVRIGLYGDVASVEENNEYEFRLICLDKLTGEILWQQTAAKQKPAVKRHAKSSHANPTAATNGVYVIASFGSEGLYCYDMLGKLIWQKDLGLLDSGWFYDPGYQWGFGSSPIIFADMVIVQCDIQTDSFIAAFKLSDGSEIWRTPREEIPSWSSPTVHEFDGMPMLMTGGTKAARGYDARTGELIWSLPEHSEIVVPTPFVAQGLMFFASGYSPIQPIYAVRPEARGEISLDGDNLNNEFISWSTKRGGPYMPTPIVYGDYLYCCGNSGIVDCYDAITGEKVYTQRMRAPGGTLAFTASPIASDGHLYFTAEDGRVLVVKAGPEFELVSTNKTGESILATPAISEGTLYLRTQDSVIAVGEQAAETSTASRDQFVSEASFIIGSYLPKRSDHAPESIAQAGQAFLKSLDEKLREKAAHDLDSPERRLWTNLPARPDAGGVRFGELNETQVKTACDLMAAVFSAQGYKKMCDIMLADDQLLRNGRPNPGFGTENFSLVVFSTPSATEPWAFQLDGHHLGVNVAIEADRMTMSPSFIGTQPEAFKIADDEIRPFANEVGDAFKLIDLLSDDQRKQAIIQPKRGFIRSGPGKDNQVPTAEGVSCATFNVEQRKTLMTLISQWVNDLPPKHAEQRMQQLESEINDMRFAWYGPTAARSDVSYAIQGPSLIIEFACQDLGGNPLDHLHSNYRDPTNEYGKQLANE